MNRIRISIVSVVALGIVFAAVPITAKMAEPIPAGSKVFIAQMDGFGDLLKAALQKKKVPLIVVDNREQADFEITGKSDSQKASTAKKVIMWNWHSNEEASINVTSLKTGEVVFAYSVHKQSSAHGRRSTAEACAKHLKERVTRT